MRLSIKAPNGARAAAQTQAGQGYEPRIPDKRVRSARAPAGVKRAKCPGMAALAPDATSFRAFGANSANGKQKGLAESTPVRQFPLGGQETQLGRAVSQRGRHRPPATI
jgi:hypothetical protein